MAFSKITILLFLICLMLFESKSDGSFQDALESACKATLDPKFCVSTMAASQVSWQGGFADLGIIALKLSINEARKVFDLISRVGRWVFNSRQLAALQDCLELLDLTLDDLNKSLSNVTTFNVNSLTWRQAVDVQTWLSAAVTNQATCLEGFQEASGSRPFFFNNNIRNVSRLLSNSLALVKNMSVVGKRPRRLPVHDRRLLSDLPEEPQNYGFFSHYGPFKGGFPSWLSASDRRRLLQTSSGDAGRILADDVVTVAQDGSGNFTTIADAINGAPNNSLHRHVIYVTEGVYQEYIDVPSYKTNIMFIGDGINSTVITGNRSVVDGWTTFRSATVAVVGQGFLARDITFENTAGPEKHQAVALRVGSDLSAFYRCSVRGYQDSLYAHSFRQFYRECDIYGTVDFIFGNAAAVFQTCNLLARKPMDNQNNIFTAQGRSDPNENTGISIQNCTITAAPDLAPVKSSIPTFLGRPWREYSRTVYIKSYIDDVVQPAGWLEWSGNFGLSTLYYGEYMNYGPGSGTAARIQWPGFHVMNISDAQTFTVPNFIAGDSWLDNVPFIAGLD